LNLSTLWLFIAPPVVGGIIGYFTNDIAIRMLFRPYKPLYLGKWQLPFTPGVIPRNQERLATRISDTIMSALLTPEELQNLTRRLLQLERVQAAILWLLKLAIEQLEGERQQKTVTVLANVLHDLFGQSLPRLLKVLARRDDFLEHQLNQIFDQFILEFHLSDQQATKLAHWLMDAVATPDTLRQLIIDFLSDRNIQVIDGSFRDKTSGTYWVVANLFGLRNALIRLRTHFIEEQEASNLLLADLLTSLTIRVRLQTLLGNLSLQNLPIATVRQIRKTLRDTVRQYLQEQGSDFLEELSQAIDWQGVSSLILNRLRNSAVMDESLEVISMELALILERYLEHELESLVAQLIPILQIDQVIIERVKATSPADLEDGINGIVRTELQAIVNLGGVLGFVICLLQSASLLLR